MKADGYSGGTCTQRAEPRGGFRSWEQGKDTERAGQGPKIGGERDVRHQPCVGKVSGDLHYLPSDGDVKSPARMPLQGACLDLRRYCLGADGPCLQLAGGCWLPKSSWTLKDPFRHRVTYREN